MSHISNIAVDLEDGSWECRSDQRKGSARRVGREKIPRLCIAVVASIPRPARILPSGLRQWW